MRNQYTGIYYRFLRLQLASILQIATFFLMPLFLLPNNLVKLIITGVAGFAIYLYLLEQGREYIVGVIKNQPADVDLNHLNDGELAGRWHSYTAVTALILTIILGTLSYNLGLF